MYSQGMNVSKELVPRNSAKPVTRKRIDHGPIIVKFPISDLDTKTKSKLHASHFVEAAGTELSIKGSNKSAILLHCCDTSNFTYVLVGGDIEEDELRVKKYNRFDLEVQRDTKHRALSSSLRISQNITILGKVYSCSYLKKHGKDTIHLNYGTKNKNLPITLTTFKSYYYLCKSARIMFENAKIKHVKHNNPLPTGNCTGMSVVFHAQESGKLKAYCIFSKIPYLALSSDSPNRWFVATRNFTKIPPLCRGFVVAYTRTKMLTTHQFSTKINGSDWKLGIIVSMDKNIIRIAETTPMSADGKYSIGEVINIEVGNDITIQYLNVINYHSVCKDGFIVASGMNPDIAKLRKEDNIMLQKQRKLSKGPVSSRPVTQDMSFNYKKYMSSFLTSCNSKTRGSIARKGAHVIIVEGPVSKLKCNNSLEKEGFLCPRYEECTQNQKSFRQSYTRISKTERASRRYLEFNDDAHKLNPFLDEIGIGKETDLLCLDASKFPNGIMIVYSQNENLSEMRIKEKYDLNEEGKEHWDLVDKGIVLSHWIPHKLAMENSVQDIKITLLHNRNTHGYGNGRNVTNSVGGNRYHGQKLSGRAITHPDCSQEMTRYVQLDRQDWDQTYAPLFIKRMNALTKQASDLSALANPLLHRFLTEIKKRLGFGDNSTSFRAHCFMSILTYGDDASKTDGFSNEIHFDPKDTLPDNFTKMAHTILDELSSKDVDGLKSEISYLRQLIGLCGGIAAPSTCGYSIVDLDKHEENANEMRADFVMPGLGISVKMCSKVYHYFYGSAFSHCTALPLTIHCGDKIITYAKKFNVTGWGATRGSSIVPRTDCLYDPNEQFPNEQQNAKNLFQVRSLFQFMRCMN